MILRSLGQSSRPNFAALDGGRYCLLDIFKTLVCFLYTFSCKKVATFSILPHGGIISLCFLISKPIQCILVSSLPGPHVWFEWHTIMLLKGLIWISIHHTAQLSCKRKKNKRKTNCCIKSLYVYDSVLIH